MTTIQRWLQLPVFLFSVAEANELCLGDAVSDYRTDLLTSVVKRLERQNCTENHRLDQDSLLLIGSASYSLCTCCLAFGVPTRSLAVYASL
jgi:hypothetical protein